jgi:hypothetical protein
VQEQQVSLEQADSSLCDLLDSFTDEELVLALDSPVFGEEVSQHVMTCSRCRSISSRVLVTTLQ